MSTFRASKASLTKLPNSLEATRLRVGTLTDAVSSFIWSYST